MKTQDIDELKILKYLTQVIPAQMVIDYITAGGSVDDLKQLGLITKTVPTEVIEEEIGISGYKFTIVPTPSDATVVINGVEQSSVSVASGTEITWSVSKTGYISQTGTYTMEEEDYDLEVELEQDYIDQYLTFKFLGNGSVHLYDYHWYEDGSYGMYSLNGGDWIEIASNNINVQTNDKLRIKGVGYTLPYDSGVEEAGFMITSVDCEVYGNILSLTFGDEFRGKENVALTRRQFYYALSIDGLISAENLILPSTILAEDCYACMFSRCNKLTKAPVLPATSLANMCYDRMFIYCSNLNNIICLAEGNQNADWGTYDGSDRTLPATGTFIKNDNSTWPICNPSEDHYSGIPDGWDILNENTNYTFTIVATPADATVTINGKTRSSYTTYSGATVTWEVEKENYATQTGTYTLNSDHTENVTLNANPTFTIVPTPDTATVEIKIGEGDWVSTRTVTAPVGTEISWGVEDPSGEYNGRWGDYTMTNEDHIEYVDLTQGSGSGNGD